MRIFLTGATGYVGSAVADALHEGGHELTALARSEESAQRVRARGFRPIAADLRNTGDYRDAALAHDAIVHVGIEAGAERLQTDGIVVAALASPKLVYTSTTFVLGDVGDADESAPAFGQRADHESIVLRAGGAVVRLGMVIDAESWLVQEPIYIDDGTNRWPLVHRTDAARLYRLVVERGAAGIFHGVCHVIRSRDLTSRGRSVSLEDARRELGTFADALALDQNVRTTRSRELGWTCGER